MTNNLTVKLKERSYPIFFDVPLSACAETLLPLVSSKKAFVITDENVAALYLQTVVDSFEKAGCSVSQTVVPAGESSKSFFVLESVLDALLQNGCDRKSFIVALGGGVVGDLSGFAASIVLRGIDFVQIPTTLLACVDSSVGGKTAVNAKAGKNLIGTFYQPKAVLIDKNVLKTLPERQLLAGYAETVKYGLIADKDFFERLEKNPQDVLNPDNAACVKAIETSCRLKAETVACDERETGQARALLNFGHTFGHALEAAHAYDGSMLHGEAVALGMLLAIRLSVMETGLDASVYERIKAHFKAAGLPVVLPRDYNADDLTQKMFADKKTLNQKLNLVLLKELGKAVLVKDVSPDKIKTVWCEALKERTL